MAKVLLVEDDTNLREIFEMRLQAEGYDTSVAGDGEEALVVALKDKPDLIIADVMMPKMSGFEMLENLRAAPEMAKAKVIMMTALGQDDDRNRGEKLGVLKYLVKSQVTLEDFVRTVKEVVGDGTEGAVSTTDLSTEPKTANNKLGGDKNMDDNTQPANPAPAEPASGGTDGGSTNPISGAPADDQMSSAQAQDNMNQQVNDAMGGSPPASGQAPTDSGADGAPGGDTSATPADVPMSAPPADQPAGDEGQTPSQDQQPPAAGPAPSGV